MTSTTTHISVGGRGVTPAAIRRALGLKDGDEVIVSLDDKTGEVRIATRRQRLRQAQDLVKARVRKGRSLSAELIAERRAEADHD